MTSRSTETICRVCGSALVRTAGVVEYFAGYAWTVYDCDACGCRFTQHDATVYSVLHKFGATSYYAEYRELEAECRSLFEQRNQEALKNVLCQTSKYRFIIDNVASEPASSRLLELGCSRGYLTSYFVLRGRDVLGVDVAEEPVESARAAFGKHFELAGSPRVDRGVPYDVIYHVGMIGCVGDPVGLTKQLLAMLKPGGRLLFNAPNRGALYLRDQLWLDTAPPPDLVTLFPEGFWKRHFSNGTDVIERVELLPEDSTVAVSLGSMCGRRWRKPVPQPLAPAGILGHTWTQQVTGCWRIFERATLKASRLTGLAVLAPQRPSDFGLFVQMTVKA
jgi:SAM-dependent methyltransferase